ncbi:MAG: F0F1 ATP synthase subunit delta [Synechococcaceae cyanobacterium SM1_2_3]|nr:F0F1 ATP synthase subunit delta [Synechococcaceae cyanobacterium SM1_2_3]
MAETTTVVRPTAAARPYARAAFEDAQISQAIPLWSDLLEAAAAIAADSALHRLLGPWNPVLRGQQKAELMAELCREACGGIALPEAFTTFLRLLADNHRLHLLPSIAVLYERLRAEAESIVRAELISAITVTDAQRKRVIKALKARFKRSVVLDCKIDEALVAGAVIRVGDLVIDGSARGRLNKLATALSQ